MNITIEMTKEEKEVTNPLLATLIAHVVAENSDSEEVIRINVNFTKESQG